MTLPGECDHGEWKCMRQVIYLKIGKCAGFSVLKSVHSLCCVCFSVLNPFPAKSFVLLAKIASENSLSQKFCWPEVVFASKTLLQFGVLEKWELKEEVVRRPTDMQKPLCEGRNLTS